MDTDDDLFLDAVEAVVLDVLSRLGNDAEARFAFFHRLLDVAREVASRPGRAPGLES